MRLIAFALILATITTAASAKAAGKSPHGNDKPAAWTPDTIPWRPTNADGTRFAMLEGVRDVAGIPFTYAFFIPAAVWDAPNSHAATARVVVARGSLHLS